MRARSARGLTLVELLVTLVLVALAASLVIGGIGQAGTLLAKLGAEQGQIYDELMARAWIRASIGAAAPPAGEQRAFEGGSLVLRLQSFRPLLGAEGIATAIEWRIAGDAGLLYVERDQTVVLDMLPPVLGFEYQDANREWHDEWPVDEGGALPARVRLLFAGNDDRIDIALAPRGAPGGEDEEALYDTE